MTLLTNYWRYIVIFLAGCFLTWFIQPTATTGKEFHATTTVTIETIQTTKLTNVCKSTATTKPDGTTVIETVAVQDSQSSAATKTDQQTSITQLPTRKPLGLGVSVYLSNPTIKLPTTVSKEMVTIQVDKTIIGDTVTLGLFYKLSGEVGIGLGIRF